MAETKRLGGATTVLREQRKISLTSIRRQLKAVKNRVERQQLRETFVAKGLLTAFPQPRRDASVPKKTWWRAGGTKKYVPKSRRNYAPAVAKK